ncbi:MAG TPA: XRE family transcriptional regulator [Candidatus Fraserbacteria bacterium]|nr:XRE family transcriptional regulator [Candidatus Fraserbacteria bacterium]
MQNTMKQYTVSSGNVFHDLELPGSEEMLAKAELARQIAAIVRCRHLNQAKTARLLGTTQPKISALLNGNLAGFSLERLIRFLTTLGRDVQIVVNPKPSNRPHARLSVAGGVAASSSQGEKSLP